MGDRRLPWTGSADCELRDGLIVVHHREPPRESLRLWVSPLTGERLTIGAQEIDLTAWCEQPLLLELSLTSGKRRQNLSN
jgi:hypothetical protein